MSHTGAWIPFILLKGWLTEAGAVVVVVPGLMNGPLFRLAASYAPGRARHESMTWKHDLTLWRDRRGKNDQDLFARHNSQL